MNEPPIVQQQDEFTMANNNGMNTRRDARIGGSFSSFGQQNSDYYSSNNASSAFHHSPKNNNMASSSRSPSDPPFWGQQQQHQQMHQQNHGNNNNVSSKDRSRSMGSSPAPFNNMNMRYDMGGQGFNDSTRFGNNNDYYQETNNNNSFQTSSNDRQRQQYPPNAQQFAPSTYNSNNINSMNNNVTETRSTPPHSSTMDFMLSDAPHQQNNESKRRKVNSSSSSDLLLQMLNETLLMSPESIAKPAVFGGGQYQQQQSLRQHQSNSCGASPSTSNNVSPFTNYINKPTLLTYPHKSRFDNEPPKISPNPLSIKDGNINSNSIGDTPRLFADYFLCNNDGNHGVDMNAMPPLPLVPVPTDSTTTTSNNSKNSMDPQESAAPFKKSFNQASLPLPPKKSHGSSSKKKSKGGSSQKKRSSNNDGGDKPTGPNPNHIITPTSATISGIAAEIREQMQQQQQKKKKQQVTSSTTSSANTQKGKDVSSSRINNEADSQSKSSSDKKSDNFFVPQFASTMEASQASQQAIHDWDRKFGLRRAHSKTMRESCRSRKRVLEFLKGAGANLQLLSESLSAREMEINRSVLLSSDNSPTTCQETKEEEVNATTTRELDRPVHIKKKIGHDTKYKLGKSVLSNEKTTREQVEQSPSTPSTKNDNESDNSLIMSPNKPPNNAKKTRHLKPSRRHSIVESKIDRKSVV